MSNIINVNLYGGKGIFGGRETPLEADVIHCNHASTCSLYARGKCLNCRAMFGSSCEFGYINTIKGYTSRAAKYYDFKHKWESDEHYHKLAYPYKCRVAVMNNHVYLNTKYVSIRKCIPDEEEVRDYNCKYSNGYKIYCSIMGGNCVFIPKEDFTHEFLYDILSYKPHAIMGGVIEAYSIKEVPEILLQLKSELPEFHAEFIKKYTEFDITPNYIGKKAYVKSLKDGDEFIYDDIKWRVVGDCVESDEYKPRFYNAWSKNKCFIRLPINDEMLFEIKDNSIVTSDTVFYD